jgi:hypothetical protein
MANFVFNIAKGRVVEYYNRVKGNDPTTSQFVIIPLETSGLEAQSVLEDVDTVTALLAGTTNEQITIGRKTLTDTQLAALPAPDDTNNRYDLDLPDFTWVAATGNAISALAICYDVSQGGDGTIIPMTYHDFVVTPDGTDITATTTLFFRAS